MPASVERVQRTKFVQLVDSDMERVVPCHGLLKRH